MSRAIEADDGSADDLVTEHDDEAIVRILTYGDPIRSWVNAVQPVDDEIRLQIDSDGLHTQAVDPAKVFMGEVTAYAEGFDRFEVETPITVGLSLPRFADAVGFARKIGGDGDPVTIDVFDDPTRIRVGVTRPDRGMKRYSEWFAIDPENIRQEPTVPDVNLPNRADPTPRALADGVESISEDHAYVTRDDDTFVIATRDDAEIAAEDHGEIADTVLYPNTAWDTREDDRESSSSSFSLDYLEDLTDAIVDSKADRVAVSWGDDFPAKFIFEHDEWGFEGQYHLAPRIESEGDS